MYVDPSGKEKIPWLNTKKQENNNLLQGVKCYKDNIPNIINIFAHGNNDVGWKNGFIRENGGEWYNVSSFEKMLAGQSTIWKNKNIDDKITIIFHVCNLDLDDNNSKSPSLSFAKRLSASPEFQNVVVVASEGGVEYGVKITKKDGKPINTSFIESSESNWNVYYKGKLIGTYDKENSMEGKNPREDFKQQIEELDKMQ